ncbi:MAG TPA: chromate transporter [Vicinamibacterales bacterium]|nr:chromate transporter [Vicinamibacterales bacterium]
MPSLRQIFGIVARDVNSTVGGGMAAIELLRRLFTGRGWLSNDEYVLVMAVSRLTPGTNILAFCVAMGWHFRRLAGSITAVAAASLPSSLIILGLSAVVVRVAGDARVQVVLSILMLVACYLITMVAWNLLRPFLFSAARWRAAAITVVAVALYVVGFTPVRILFASAIVGLVLPMPPVRRGGSSDPPASGVAIPPASAS